MVLVLGRTPDSLTVHLTRGTALTATLRSQDSAGDPVNWPEGTSLRLEIERGIEYGESWEWVIDGPTASLTIPAADVDALPTRALSTQLWLDYGDGEFLWCSGTVLFHA